MIGSGGMGEVYRGRDSRLARDVAIKVLPPAFSSDRDRLHRFEQEARAAAALNHPNILAVYDIGDADGAPFIVSELLEGQTLRACLDAGAIAPRKAVDYAVQIAHGLAAAHEKGIVHRDLKPENLYVTESGRVKILDFGLAKLTQDQPTSATASALPTLPSPTQPGVVLGTVGYMAPEQVRGLTADHRSDIFAFGTTLYEMLTGQRAFAGDTVVDAMTAILKDEPFDRVAMPVQAPPGLMRLVQRCLEKNPAARFQTASDLAFAIESLSQSSAGPAGSSALAGTPGSERALPPDVHATSPRRGRIGREAAAWGLAAAGALAVAFLAWRSPAAGAVTDSPRVQFTFAAPPQTIFPVNNAMLPPIPSPDGKMVAFLALLNGRPTIYVRFVDSLVSRPIATEEAIAGGVVLFWSPDSRQLGFYTAAALKKIDVSQPGAAAQTIVEVQAVNAPTAAWSDSTIVFGATTVASLSRVPVGGGPVTPATSLDPSRKETGHRVVQFLPDGRHFLYVASPGNETLVGSLDGEPPKLLLTADSKAMYSAGHLLFVRQGTLLAQPFDVGRLELTADPFSVASGLESGVGGGSAFSASAGGALAYRANVSRPSRFEWFDRRGIALTTVGEEALWFQFALSPDGRFVAAQRSESVGAAADIWLLDVTRGVSRRLTSEQGSESDPIWSPDGQFVAYTRSPTGVQDIYRKNVVSGEETRLAQSATPKFPETWSRDGQFIMFHSPTAGSPTINILPLAEPRTPSVWLSDRFLKDESHFSPDDRWLVYQSTESGQFDVYVQPFPGPGGKVRVSSGGGGEPRWRGDGKEIFYLTQDGTVMAAPITTTATSIEPGMPKALFKTRIAVQLTIDQYAVTSDGQRFLIEVPTGDGGQSPITVVLNWANGPRR